MDIHTHIVLSETKLKVAEAERHAQLARVLAEARKTRPSLRARTAIFLVALANKLSPEVKGTFEKQPCPE